MERQSFLFRKEWCDAASGLRPQLRLELFDAIISYGLTGKVPQVLREVVGLAFGFAKAVIDRDNEELTKREAVSKRNRDNALKRCQKEVAQATAQAKENDENAENPADTSHARVIEDNNKNISIDKKEDIQKIEKETHKKEKESLDREKVPSLTREKALEILDYFNKQVKEGDSKIPKCVKLSDQRYSHLKQRYDEYGKDSIIEAIDKTFKSDFLTGRKDNRNNWRASFDWLFCPTNFLKVIEGNYDNIKTSTANGNTNSTSNIDPRRGTDATCVSIEDYEKGF